MGLFVKSLLVSPTQIDVFKLNKNVYNNGYIYSQCFQIAYYKVIIFPTGSTDAIVLNVKVYVSRFSRVIHAYLFLLATKKKCYPL